MEHFTNFYQLTQLEIVGMEVKQVPFLKRLSAYESNPLQFYRLIVKYQGKRADNRRKPFSGQCMVILRTVIKNHGGLVLVQGCITIHSCPSNLLAKINYVPKQEIDCPMLNDFITCYIGKNGLWNRFFNPKLYGTIKNPLFTCQRVAVPMINGYNRDGKLDRVSVDMDLFEPVKMP